MILLRDCYRPLLSGPPPYPSRGLYSSTLSRWSASVGNPLRIAPVPNEGIEPPHNRYDGSVLPLYEFGMWAGLLFRSPARLSLRNTTDSAYRLLHPDYGVLCKPRQPKPPGAPRKNRTPGNCLQDSRFTTKR